LPGCLPLHGRDPQLVEHILADRPLRLVGGGAFLQHPVFAPDLAKTILSAAVNPAATGRTFNVNGPEVIESRTYYRVLAALLGREVVIEDVPADEFLASHPDKAPFCCDRVYDLTALRSAGINLPATQLEDGLRRQLETLDR
jgi:nucleoside-diphosphate-sugar epimerase